MSHLIIIFNVALSVKSLRRSGQVKRTSHRPALNGRRVPKSALWENDRKCISQTILVKLKETATTLGGHICTLLQVGVILFSIRSQSRNRDIKEV